MGIFGSIGKALGGLAKGVGSIVSKAAPLASLIPGLGPVASLGGGVLGKVLQRLGGGGGGQQGGTLLSALVPGAGGFPGGGGGAGGGGGGGGLGGILQTVLGSLGKAAPYAVGGAGALASSKQMGEALSQLRGAQERAQADYESRSPFREALLARLSPGGSMERLMASRPGFDPGAFRNPENPFARAVAAVQSTPSGKTPAAAVPPTRPVTKGRTRTGVVPGGNGEPAPDKDFSKVLRRARERMTREL